MAALLCSLTLYQARQHRPCHQRAIHSGLKRSPDDTHGQHHGTGELRRSPPFQVTIPPDLALGAGVADPRSVAKDRCHRDQREAAQGDLRRMSYGPFWIDHGRVCLSHHRPAMRSPGGGGP